MDKDRSKESGEQELEAALGAGAMNGPVGPAGISMVTASGN